MPNFNKYSENTKKVLETYLNDIEASKYNENKADVDSQSAEKTFNNDVGMERIKHLSRSVVKKIKDKVGEEKLFELLQKVGKQDSLDYRLKRVVRFTNITIFNRERTDLEKDTTKSFLQKDAELQQLTSEKGKLEDYKDLRDRELSSIIADSIKSPEDLDLLLNTFEEEGINPEEIFNEKILTALDEDYPADRHPKETEINEIINTLNPDTNKEEIEALKYANEIIILGNPNDLEFTSQVAENYGKTSERKYSYELNKEAKKVLSDSSFLEEGTSSLEIKGDLESKGKFSNGLKELEAKKPVFNKDIAKELVDIVREGENAGIFDKRYLSGGEAGGKIYSLGALVRKRKEVEEAVNKKDLEQVKKLTKEYKALDDTYLKLMDRLKKLGIPGEISQNISSSREALAPQKYRADFIGVTRLTNIWNIYSQFENLGIKFEEAINDPFTALKKAYEISIHGDTYADNFLQNATNLEVMRGLVYARNSIVESIISDQTIDGLALRGITNLAYYLPEGQERNTFNLTAGLSSLVVVSNSQYRHHDALTSHNGSELLSNVLITEPKDRSLYDMTGYGPELIDITTYGIRKNYPSVEYLNSEKTTASNIVERAGDLLEIYANNKNILNNSRKGDHLALQFQKTNDLLLDTFKKTAEKIEKSNLEVDPEEEVILEQFKTLDQKSVLQVKVLACTLQARYYSQKKDCTVDDCESALYNLASLRKEWKGRNFLQKMFGSETRQLSRDIDHIKRILNRGGITNEMIDKETNLYNGKPPKVMSAILQEQEFIGYRTKKEPIQVIKESHPEKNVKAINRVINAQKEPLVENVEVKKNDNNVVENKEEVKQVEINLDNGEIQNINKIEEVNVAEKEEVAPISQKALLIERRTIIKFMSAASQHLTTLNNKTSRHVASFFNINSKNVELDEEEMDDAKDNLKLQTTKIAKTMNKSRMKVHLLDTYKAVYDAYGKRGNATLEEKQIMNDTLTLMKKKMLGSGIDDSDLELVHNGDKDYRGKVVYADYRQLLENINEGIKLSDNSTLEIKDGEKFDEYYNYVASKNMSNVIKYFKGGLTRETLNTLQSSNVELFNDIGEPNCLISNEELNEEDVIENNAPFQEKLNDIEKEKENVSEWELMD